MTTSFDSHGNPKLQPAIAALVDALRRYRGMSKAELARRMRTSRSQIDRFLGGRATLSPQLERAVRALGGNLHIMIYPVECLSDSAVNDQWVKFLTERPATKPQVFKYELLVTPQSKAKAGVATASRHLRYRRDTH